MELIIPFIIQNSANLAVLALFFSIITLFIEFILGFFNQNIHNLMLFQIIEGICAIISVMFLVVNFLHH